MDVCNQALHLNKDRFPFKQILGAACRAENGNMIELHIIDNQKTELNQAANYTITINQKEIIAKPHSECGECECIRQWSIEKDYLQQVSDNPQKYINNPAHINWEWMFDQRCDVNQQG